MSWQVRRPSAADADAIATINVRAWQHAYAGLMPASVLERQEVAPRAERLRERLTSGTGAPGFVAVAPDGVVAGYCWFGDYRPDEDLPAPGEGWGEFYAIYVDPDRIGTGAGATLMTAALTALHPRPVAVWVLEGNARARAFYERFGFRHDGTVTDFDAGGTPVPEIRYVGPS
ncbi:GNAT family N-acetyltransferase [Pseudactinotalea suaedae]